MAPGAAGLTGDRFAGPDLLRLSRTSAVDVGAHLFHVIGHHVLRSARRRSRHRHAGPRRPGRDHGRHRGLPRRCGLRLEGGRHAPHPRDLLACRRARAHGLAHRLGLGNEGLGSLPRLEGCRHLAGEGREFAVGPAPLQLRGPALHHRPAFLQERQQLPSPGRAPLLRVLPHLGDLRGEAHGGALGRQPCPPGPEFVAGVFAPGSLSRRHRCILLQRQLLPGGGEPCADVFPAAALVETAPDEAQGFVVPDPAGVSLNRVKGLEDGFPAIAAGPRPDLFDGHHDPCRRLPCTARLRPVFDEPPRVPIVEIVCRQRHPVLRPRVERSEMLSGLVDPEVSLPVHVSRRLARGPAPAPPGDIRHPILDRRRRRRLRHRCILPDHACSRRLPRRGILRHLGSPPRHPVPVAFAEVHDVLECDARRILPQRPEPPGVVDQGLHFLGRRGVPGELIAVVLRHVGHPSGLGEAPVERLPGRIDVAHVGAAGGHAAAVAHVIGRRAHGHADVVKHAVAVVVGGRPCRTAAAARIGGARPDHPLGHVIMRRHLRIDARPGARQVLVDRRFRDWLAGLVFRQPFPQRGNDRRLVDMDRQVVPVTGEGGVDRRLRRPVVGEDEGRVHRASLGARHGHRVAVIQPDAAVIVDDLVDEEAHVLAVFRAPDDLDPLVSGKRVDDAEVLDLDDGAVEEALVPHRRANAQEVAPGDLERHGALVVRPRAAGMDDDALVIAGAGERALSHEMREHADLVVGARDHRRRAARVGLAPCLPVVDQVGERLLQVTPEVKLVTHGVGLDRRRGVAVAQRFRGGDLPGHERRLLRHRLELRDDARASLVAHEAGAKPRVLFRKAVDMHQDVLQIGPLPADLVDAHARRRLAHQAQARAGADGLVLPGVACGDDLAPVLARELEDVMRLARRQHAGLVDDDHRVLVEGESAARHEPQKLVDGIGRAGAVVAKADGRAPCDGRRDHRVAALPVEVGDRPQRRGLAGSRRPFDDGERAAGRPGAVTDRGNLFAAERIALGNEPVDLRLDHRCVEARAAVGRRFGSHAPDRFFHADLLLRGEDPGVGKAGVGLDGMGRHVEFDDFVIAQDAPHRDPRGFGSHDARRGVHGLFDDVGHTEDGLVFRQFLGHALEPFGGFPERLLVEADVLAGDAGDQGLAVFHEDARLEVPGDVTHVLAFARRLGLAGHLVDRRGGGRIRVGDEAHVVGHRLDGAAPLRPFPHEILRHAGDARERAVAAVALHFDAQALLQVPGKRMAVGGAGGLHPAEHGRRVERPELAVGSTRGVEDQTVRVKLRIVGSGRSVLEHRAHQLGADELDVAAAGSRARPPAVRAHDVLERLAAGVVVRLGDLVAHLLGRDRPQGADRLVGREGDVNARRAGPGARVPGEAIARLRIEAVIDLGEVQAVDRAAVVEAEKAGRIPPHAVRFVALDVVSGGGVETARAHPGSLPAALAGLARRPEALLRLKVVAGHGHPAQGGDHHSSSTGLRGNIRVLRSVPAPFRSAPGARSVTGPGSALTASDKV